MNNKSTRNVLALGAAIALSLTFVGCSSAPSDTADDKTTETVTFSAWDTGMTGGIAKALAEDTETQEKFGVKVKVRSTPNLPEVYSNLLTGAANANIGSPESFASMNEKGGNIQIVGLFAPNTTAIMGKTTGDPAKVLRGKRLASVTASSGWAVLNAAIERDYGLKAGTDYEVVTVPNTLAGAAQVEAGTADFVMGWEPSITQVLTSYSDQKVLASAEELGIGNSKQFLLGVSGDLSDETIKNLLGALNATVEKLQTDKALADKIGATQGYTDDIMSKVLAAGTFPIDAKALDAESQDLILKDLQVIFEAGGLQKAPTASIFRKE